MNKVKVSQLQFDVVIIVECKWSSDPRKEEKREETGTQKRNERSSYRSCGVRQDLHHRVRLEFCYAQQRLTMDAVTIQGRVQ